MTSNEKILYDIIQYDKWRDTYLFRTESSRWTHPTNPIIKFLHLILYYIIFPFVLLFTIPHKLISKSRKHPAPHAPMSLSISPCHRHLAVLTPSSLLILVRNSKLAPHKVPQFSRQSGYIYSLADDVILRRGSPFQVAWSLDSKYTVVLVSSTSPRIMVFDTRANKIGDVDLSAHEVLDPCQVLLVGCGPHQMIHRCLLLSRAGSLHWFSVRNSGELGEVCHKVELSETHPRGVYVMHFHAERELLYLGGSGTLGGERGHMSTLKRSISVWRVVEEDPGFVQVHHSVGESNQSPSRRGDDVIDMCINSNSQLLLTSHQNGLLAIWHIPSLTHYKHFYSHAQGRSRSDRLLSLSWWSEGGVMASYTSGRLALFDPESGLNVLKEATRIGAPLILSNLSTVKSALGISYEGLTDNLDSNKNVMNLKERFCQFVYVLTGIHSLQQFEVSNFACEYSLVLLKQVSPFDLYKTKISQKFYQEASTLADEFSLDINLLYQSQWESSFHSVEDIYLYLTQVTDTRYVLKQCLAVSAPEMDSASRIIQVGLARIQESHCDPEVPVITDQDFSYEHRRLTRMEIMLDCYSNVLHSEKHPARFQPRIFDQMCSISLLHLMSLLAIERNYMCLQVLYHRFYLQLHPHLLAILIFIPEVEPPSEYKSLLPTGRGLPYKDNEWQHDELGESEFYTAHPGLVQFRNLVLTNRENLSEWFIFRARQIDSLSGHYSNATWLINHAVADNIPRLLPIQHDLWFLGVLVGELRDTSSELTGLNEVEKLSNLERIQFVLEGVVVANFFERFKKYIETILEFYETSAQGNKLHLMKQFMLDLAHENLPLCQVLFQRSFVDKHLILSTADMTQLAIDCIYSCEIPAHLANAFSIFECLPSGEDTSIESLACQLNQLEMVLKSVSILQNYSIFLCPNEILDHQKGEEQEVRLLILRLSRQLSKQKVFPSQRVWEQLLSDILSLREAVFPQLRTSSCYSLFSHTLMSSQCSEGIHLAASLLRLDPGGLSRLSNETHLSDTWKCHLSYEDSVQVVLQASQEYFNASSHFMDQDMQLARSCLHLMQPTPATLQEELNLIAVLSLLDDFRFEIMPAQLRACEDRFRLVEDVISLRPDNYRKKQKIDKLLHLLQISTTVERDGTIDYDEILIFIAEKALEADDCRTCEYYCYLLMRSHYPNAWSICHQLGAIESFDMDSSKTLIGYSIENCPPEKLALVLATSTNHTTQMLERATSVSTSAQVMYKMARIMGKALRTTGLGSLSYLSGFAQRNNDDTTNSPVALSISKYHFYDTTTRKYISPTLDQVTSYHVQLFKGFTILQENDILQEILEDSPRISNLNTYMVTCLKSAIHSDTALSIGYMFAIHNRDLVWNSLLELSRHRLTSELYLYYLATLICSHVLKQHCAISNTLFMNPLEFVQCFERRFFQRIIQDCSDTLTLKFDYARHHLQALWESDYLQEMKLDFDVDLYFADRNYQTVIIKMLSEDCETFDFALSIAHYHDIGREVIFIHLLTSLLLNSQLSLNQLQSLFVEKGLTECLQDHPLTFCEAIQNKILPHISGTNYDKILSCFNLLSECESTLGDPIYAIPNSKLSCRELTEKILFFSQTVPLMDFRAFSESPNPVYVLKQHLTFQNIPRLSEAGSLIVATDQVPITESDLYWAFCCHQTDQYKPASDDIGVDNSSLISAMNHLSIEQILRIYKEVLFSRKSLSMSPTELQLKFQFICTALNQISAHAIKKELHLQISLFSKHMHVCFSPPISSLQMIKLKNKFYLSTSEPDSVASLLSNALSSGSSVQIISQVLTAASSVCEQTFDLPSAFREVIISLCYDLGKEISSKKQEATPKITSPSFETIKLLFESLDSSQNLMQSISPKFLSQLLKEILNLSDLPLEFKSSISELFHSDPISEDWSIIKLKIKAHIDLYWDYDVSSIDVSFHDDQVTLVTDLINTGNHHPAVNSILTYFPDSKKTLCDCWLSLMLSWSRSISNIIEFVIARFDLEFDEIQDEKIATTLSSTNMLFQVLYLLVTPHKQMKIDALKSAMPLLADYTNVCSIKAEIYELILLNDLSHFLVETKIWESFMTHIQESPLLPLTEVGRLVNNKLLVVSGDITGVDALCSQLYQGGYKLEAAVIRNKSSLPPRFISFNSVVKWINQQDRLY